MNKSALRNFAVWARRDLIKRISDRANLLGVYEDKPTKQIQAETSNGFIVNGVTFNYKKEMREAFIKRIQQIGYRDTIEEIAYTWFNRIVALRFMEVNGYLKNGNGDKIYVIGSTFAGKTEPDAITYADKLSFVDKFKVYDYQDANDTNGLYRYILTSLCNNLNEVMPLMFEKIDNYVELLLPDHLLDKGAIIDHLVNDISARDFNITVKDEDGENASQVEIIGWLYQFYISEKKDEVFASKDQINKGTLPAVTQLFTPDWIVKYMTENSLGKMWVDGHKSSNLKQGMKYFVEEAEQTDDVKVKLEEINKEYASKKVTEITFIDPCCGSGHILVYAFDLFFKMYQESGFVASEIPTLILKNNLFGIDVDKRAAQLTSFALTMKALSYDKNFLSKKIYPNVIDIKESNEIDQLELKDFIRVAKLDNKDEEVLLDLVEKFKDAELYGSLIKDFNYSTEQYDILLKVIEQIEDVQFNLIDALAIHNVKPIIIDLVKQAIILSSKYDVVATNPPYMPTSSNDKLKEFAFNFYPNSKTDLFAMFMETELVNYTGFLAMINMNAWMFLSSYDKLRDKIIKIKDILSMLHLGPRAFEEIGGEVVQTTAFVLRNKISLNGKFYRLVGYKNPAEKERQFLLQRNNYFIKNVGEFDVIPGKPIVYWIAEKFIKLFNNDNVGKYCKTLRGYATASGDSYVRDWIEVKYNDIAFNINSNEEAYLSQKRWFLYNKGGQYRKWFGNNYKIVDYYKNGNNYKTIKGFCFSNQRDYFRESITWSKISSGHSSFRYNKNSYIFGDAGPALQTNYNLKYFMALLNSNISNKIQSFINPTLNTTNETLDSIPVVLDNKKDVIINKIVDENIYLSKNDWDLDETSWDFKKNPLLPNVKVFDLESGVEEYHLEATYDNYKEYVNNRFNQLKSNEEELNKIFIDIYGLQDELTPDVADKDITVARIYDSKDEIPEDMKGNIYVKTKQDVIKDLISYIVGCAFGRYSPYKDGLIFAGGKFDYDKYLYITNSLEQPLTHNGLQNYAKSFMPSEENCIMITDNDYGTNNLVDYVVSFVRKVYTSECLEENLRFIANALNEKSTDTPRNVIREYLANDFFKDHCKKYQNRPIYWQFDSGKNGGFRALMYLHRYDENTIPTARLSYLHDIQWKYEQEKDRLEKLIENTSITSEKAKARKELDLIDKQILECKEYDEVLNHAANMRISIDLDDGVKVNYQKFQKLDGDKDKNILSTYLKF